MNRISNSVYLLMACGYLSGNIFVATTSQAQTTLDEVEMPEVDGYLAEPYAEPTTMPLMPTIPVYQPTSTAEADDFSTMPGYTTTVYTTDTATVDTTATTTPDITDTTTLDITDATTIGIESSAEYQAELEKRMNDSLSDLADELGSLGDEESSDEDGDITAICSDDIISADFLSDSTTESTDDGCSDDDSEATIISSAISMTSDGISAFVSNVTSQISSIIAGSGVCDPANIASIDATINKFELLQKFLHMNPGFVLNLFKKKVPAAFKNMNVNELNNKMTTLMMKVEKFRMDAMEAGKTGAEIEALLEANGAKAAMENLQKQIELAQELQMGVSDAIMTLEMAKMMIQYICDEDDIADTTADMPDTTIDTILDTTLDDTATPP